MDSSMAAPPTPQQSMRTVPDWIWDDIDKSKLRGVPALSRMNHLLGPEAAPIGLRWFHNEWPRKQTATTCDLDMEPQDFTNSKITVPDDMARFCE